jgi:hypothetical protein
MFARVAVEAGGLIRSGEMALTFALTCNSKR